MDEILSDIELYKWIWLKRMDFTFMNFYKNLKKSNLSNLTHLIDCTNLIFYKKLATNYQY